MMSEHFLNTGEVNFLIQHLAWAATVNIFIAVTWVGNGCEEAEKSQRDNTKRMLTLEELELHKAMGFK